MENINYKSLIIEEVFKFVKKHKIATPLIILIFLILLIIIGWRKNVSQKPSVVAPVPIVGSITPAPSAPYFINKLTYSFPPVNGTSWDGNKLYYSNINGIYDATNNNQVVKDPIKYVSWSGNGRALYFNGKEWKIYDVSENKQSPLTVDLTYPSISSDGLYILECKGQDITIYSNSIPYEVKKSFNTNISRCLWSGSSNYIAVSTINKDGNSVEIYNEKLESQNQFQSKDRFDLVSISQNGDFFLIDQNGTLNLVIKDGKIISLYSNSKSKYQALWIDDSTIIMVETTYDNQGRQLDYFWRYVAGRMEYLTNSLPITGKINTHVPLSLNKDKNVITFSENNGRIWLLSLVPGEMAFYSDLGLSFRAMSSKGGE